MATNLSHKRVVSGVDIAFNSVYEAITIDMTASKPIGLRQTRQPLKRDCADPELRLHTLTAQPLSRPASIEPVNLPLGQY